MAQQQRLPVADYPILDSVALVCYKEKISSDEISKALKDDKRKYTVIVDNVKYALPNNGVANILNRVRGLAMDRKTGKVAEWFGPDEDGTPDDGHAF